MRLDVSFFELQAAFARRMALVTGMAEADAFRRYTTFYWVAEDNDAGLPPDRWSFDPPHPRWTAFAEAIRAGADPANYVHRHHLATIDADRQTSCFEHDYWPDLRWVRLHFGNSPNGLALRPESRAVREGELRRIFSAVAREHPDANAVRCCSWLYHVPAYRALFPRELVARLQSVGYLHQFAALWGQFLEVWATSSLRSRSHSSHGSKRPHRWRNSRPPSRLMCWQPHVRSMFSIGTSVSTNDSPSSTPLPFAEILSQDLFHEVLS